MVAQISDHLEADPLTKGIATSYHLDRLETYRPRIVLALVPRANSLGSLAAVQRYDLAIEKKALVLGPGTMSSTTHDH